MRTLFIIPLVLMSMTSCPSWDVRAEETSSDQLYDWMADNRVRIGGEMSCKITDQVVVQEEEGKPFRYTAYENSVAVGDSLILTYYTLNDKIPVSNNIGLKFGSPKENLIEAVIAPNSGKRDAKGAYFSNPRINKRIFFHEILQFFPDRIRYSSANFMKGSSLQLNRYYKSDWGGIYTALYSGQTQILTLDCRTISNQIDEVINRYRTYPGEPDVVID